MAESTQSTAALIAALETAQQRCRELEALLAERDAQLSASEARYRTFVDHTSDGLFLHRPDGCVVDVNRRACESLGYERNELIGMHPADFDPNVASLDADGCMGRLLGGEVIRFDTRHRRKDGSEFPVEVRTRLVCENGQSYALALACDITERKRAEEALRSSEQRYRTFVDHAPIGMFLQERDGRVVDVNRQACESLGYARDELIGMTPEDFDSEITPARRQQVIDRLDAGETVAFDSHHRRKDGTMFPVEVRICPFLVDGKRQLLALARDITAQQRIHAAWRQSEQRFAQFMDHLPGRAWIKDADGRYVYANEAGIQIARDGVIDKTDWELFGPDTAALFRANDLQVMVAGVGTQFIETSPREEGQIRYELVSKFPIPAADERPPLVGGIAIDITERKQAEEALRESQRFIERIATASPHIIYVFDRLREQLVYRNRPAAADLGYSPEDIAAHGGHLFVEILHPDDRRGRPELLRRWDNARDDEILESEYRLRDRDGNWHWFLAHDTVFTRLPSGQVEQIIGTAQDITAWKQAEEELAVRQAELLHASRLTTVGRMVAALSHEVAQPLSAIGNFAAASSQILDGELTLSSPPADGARQSPVSPDPPTRQHWETLRKYNQAIATQNQRCGAILQRLRDFSQRTSARRSTCDVAHLLHDSVALVANELRRHGIDVRFELATDLPPVVADRVQLQQVVVNLLTNARDAVQNQARDRRVITVRARCKADKVVFEVEDLGTGISEDAAAHLFEPFYTTKTGGMGIGLSICQSIVKDHHGRIAAATNNAGGATFSVRLPCAMRENDD
jgi:PAS domain S-box-containing protein